MNYNPMLDYYQAQYMQNMQNLQPFQRTIIDRVQGEASADVYPVQPGQEVILFDMDNPLVYRKARSADNKLEKQRFRLVPDEKEVEKKQTLDLSGYVKEEDIAQIVAEAVEKKLSEYTLRPTKKAKQAEEE